MNDAIDKIIRSRPVVLEILEQRGFDATAFRDELPVDLIAKAGTPLLHDIELDLLRIQVPSKTEGGGNAHVLYWMGVVRHKLNDKEKFEKLLPEEIGATDPVLILLNEEGEVLNKTFHETAIHRWAHAKQLISFFDIRQLMFNPLHHVMVPPHRKVSSEEIEPLLVKLLVRSKLELPLIKYHMDVPARVLGLVPGDIVEITRPSPTIGEYKVYRICSP
jgi:DNA-directed RNA polymerase subunit H (RpoH/RPB5)